MLSFNVKLKSLWKPNQKIINLNDKNKTQSSEKLRIFQRRHKVIGGLQTVLEIDKYLWNIFDIFLHLVIKIS